MSNIVMPKKRLSRKTSVSSQIYSYLRGLITTTEIKPGVSFSENYLADHFKVSRQPIREALNKLEHDDLVVIVPQKGTLVKKISGSKLKQVVFIRSTLECGSLAHIPELSERKFNGILRKMRQNLEDQQDRLSDGDSDSQFFSLDDKFHQLICAFSDAPLTWQAIQSYKGQLDRIRFLSTQQQDSSMAELIKDHEQIYQAVEQKNIVEAQRLLRTHLHLVLSTFNTIRDNYSQWFEEEDENEGGITLAEL